MMDSEDTNGGLSFSGKERVEYRTPLRKSLLGLDVLAIAKWEEFDANAFKVPREKVISVSASMDEKYIIYVIKRCNLGFYSSSESSSYASSAVPPLKKHMELVQFMDLWQG
ncbi:pre-mRNA-splicing factor ATP-dependent RNA helicase DEAH7-like [Euphorbia lathyris]|uniref:pre-mRNA-splicing factor ATP-dependent RNA helicase DEAH7-like n=1 Tax=Euphorbia lathyris TaxID=212925 RepID=UPI0033142519